MKPKKITKKKKFFQKIIIPIITLLLLEVVLYAVILHFGGFFRQIEQNALSAVQERIINRSLYIEQEMLYRWANLEEIETIVLDKTEKVLEEYHADYDEIKINSMLNEKIITEISSDLIYLLRKNSVSDVFVILDGVGSAHDKAFQTRAGLYIRDLDPTSYIEHNVDLLMERGLPSISKNLEIALDSYWKGSFLLDETVEEHSYFFKPFYAAKNSEEKKKKSEDYGYWSHGFFLTEGDGVKTFTYSIPLITKENEVFGVLGIGITHNYFLSLLNYRELSEDNMGMYILGSLDTENSILKPIFASGLSYQRHFEGSEGMPFLTLNPETFVKFPAKKSKQDFYGHLQSLHLYGKNTVFGEEELVLAGIFPPSSIFQLSQKLEFSFLILSIIAIVIGAIGAILLGKILTEPISMLVYELKQSNPKQKIVLKRLNIEEIDELTTSIEVLSNEVAESASKISKIIELSGMKFGVFELKKGQDQIFCSSGLLHLIGMTNMQTEDSYLDAQQFWDYMNHLKKYKQEGHCSIYYIPTSDQENKWIQLNYMDHKENYLGTITDVTIEMMEKLKLDYERNYDVLTDLLNRRAFKEQTEALFGKPEQLQYACMVMWDLDNLKFINDTYGHESGDLYIQAMATILKMFVGEQVISSRYSGDEFYTFFYGYETKEEIRKILHSIWEEIMRKVIVLGDNSSIKVRVSAGIAWYPEDSKDLIELIRFADFAMYSTKKNKKGMLLDFSKETYTNNSFLIQGQVNINLLIEEQRVRFAMQPIISAKTGELYGYEMLMRSEMSDFKSPLDILQIARAQSKLYHIEKLTWFLAMQTFVEQVELGNIHSDSKVFINSIACESLTEEDYSIFHKKFSRYEKQIVLELTEEEPLDKKLTEFKCEIIKKRNGLIAIDDFGAGYNSEGVLLTVFPDLIKLDMTLVRNVHTDKNKQFIIKNLIDYAKMQKIAVLAEGVEVYKELEILIKYGVDYFQGYYIGKPQFEVSTIKDEIKRQIQALQ